MQTDFEGYVLLLAGLTVAAMATSVERSEGLRRGEYKLARRRQKGGGWPGQIGDFLIFSEEKKICTIVPVDVAARAFDQIRTARLNDKLRELPERTNVVIASTTIPRELALEAMGRLFRGYDSYNDYMLRDLPDEIFSNLPKGAENAFDMHHAH